MPFTFIIVGLVLVVAAVRGQTQTLVNLLKGDFQTSSTGQHGFLPWLVSILVVGALGYIPALKNFSRLFLVLLIVVLFLSNKGFFTKLQQSLPGVFGQPATGGAGQ